MDARVDERLARRHVPDGPGEVVPPDLLEDVSGGAGEDRVEQGLVVRERREDEDRDVGVRGPDLPAHLDTGAVGEVDVDDRHVGGVLADAAQGVLGGAGLAHDLEVLLGVEHRAHPCAHHLVVVDEEHPDAFCLGHVTMLP